MTTTAVPQRAWAEQIMGLPVSIHLRGDRLTDEGVEHRIAAVFAELRHVDAVLSPYRDGSDLSAWERGALRLGDADPMLAQVLALLRRGAAAHRGVVRPARAARPAWRRAALRPVRGSSGGNQTINLMAMPSR